MRPLSRVFGQMAAFVIAAACVPAQTALGAASVEPVVDVPTSVGMDARAASVQVRVPRDVTEGDRFKVTVTVPSARDAKRVYLDRQVVDVLGNGRWESAGSAAVGGRKKVAVGTLATGNATGRYRARVAYRSGRPLVAQGRTTVWRWLELREFDQYYSTAGVWTFGAYSFAINGVQYSGWAAYSGHYPSWEGRYTLGRHCKTFRGDFGVSDASDDGTSARIEVVADETTTAYASPTLVPGAVTTAEFDIARPYRISIRATNISPEGLDVYPAI